MAGRQDDYCTEVRDASRHLTSAINELLSLQKEWHALDYGNALKQENFEGENAAILPGDVGAVVVDTANALEALMQAGHGTNVYKLA